jgi:hypothetical protein
MKKMIYIIALFCITFTFTDLSHAEGGWTGNVNLYYGFQSVDSDDWSTNSAALALDDEIGDAAVSVDQARGFGVTAAFGPRSWPVAFYVGLLTGSGDDGFRKSSDITIMDSAGTVSGKARLTVKLQELRVGADKSWEVLPNIRPYVAGGLSVIKAKGEISVASGEEVADLNISNSASWSTEDDDRAFGMWLGGGVSWTMPNDYDIGFEVSYTRATATLWGEDMEAGGINYGLFLGYHF